MNEQRLKMIKIYINARGMKAGLSIESIVECERLASDHFEQNLDVRNALDVGFKKIAALKVNQMIRRVQREVTVQSA